ncbi:MAG TPA: hypothetical protein VKA84_05530, partial [Gemmatimonadaceae bacterium]|nr:hypothetical protein [Gemmatimonadaceae bacterium]
MTRPGAGLRLAVAALLINAAAARQASGPWEPQRSGTTAGLRGVGAAGATVAWASGTGGTYLRTTDGGRTWRASVVPGADSLDFRDVHAFDAGTAVLMATAGRIYRTRDGGRGWTLAYANVREGIFLDGMAFWDERRGIAFGDPMPDRGGRFLVLLTGDGGASWREVPADRLPPSLPGEAAFAASGTSIAVGATGMAWFATGGATGTAAVARVFRTEDGGETWSVSDTPVPAGAGSRGIFSLAVAPDAAGAAGVAVGGDYQAPNEARDNVALTQDGGRGWSLPRPGGGDPAAGRPGGYRSAVAYVPGSAGRALVAVGTSGTDRSADGGATWARVDTTAYNAVAFAPAA